MKHGTAVIGINFGDEGKGAEVSFLAKNHDLCVRASGGCNAGHTVQLKDGTTHVFGHIGSAFFSNIPTYLGKKFIVNPILANRERYELYAKAEHRPKLYVDNNCLVTTIYDMVMNQAVETHRGPERHGSCGSGINETVTRSDRFPGRAIIVEDLKDPDVLYSKLKWIEDHYIKDRALELMGIDLGPSDKVLFNIYRFISESKFFLEHFIPVEVDLINDFDNILFEGSQGLMLDEDSEYFPHVTRAKTGLYNIASMIKESKQGLPCILEVRYITRPYTTRHGNGPLPFESTDLPFAVVDKTNTNNRWQGSIRFAPLYIDKMVEYIEKDLRFCGNLAGPVKVIMRCADQALDYKDIPYIDYGGPYTGSLEQMASVLRHRLNRALNRTCSVEYRHSPVCF